MGTDWMSRNGTAEAIPPCFSEYAGNQAMAHIRTRKTRASYELAA
jgi:hypothetical protein